MSWLRYIKKIGLSLTPHQPAPYLNTLLPWWVVDKPSDIQYTLERPYSPRRDKMGVVVGYTAKQQLVYQTRLQELHHKNICGGTWAKRFSFTYDLCQQKIRQGSTLYVFEDGDALWRAHKDTLCNDDDVFVVDLAKNTFGWWVLPYDQLGRIIFEECDYLGATKDECLHVAFLITQLRHQYPKTTVLRMIEQGGMMAYISNHLHIYEKSPICGHELRQDPFANKQRVLAILTHLQQWKILPEQQEKRAFMGHTFFIHSEGKNDIIQEAFKKMCADKLCSVLSEDVQQTLTRQQRPVDAIFFECLSSFSEDCLLEQARAGNIAISCVSPIHQSISTSQAQACVVKLQQENNHATLFEDDRNVRQGQKIVLGYPPLPHKWRKVLL